MPFVGCCALVYFWTLRFSRIGDFYTLRLGFFGNLDLRIINKAQAIVKNLQFIHNYILKYGTNIVKGECRDKRKLYFRLDYAEPHPILYRII